MELDTTILYSSLSLIFLIISLKFLFQSKKQYKNLPPSPPSLPIIGHLHMVESPLTHRFYHSLAQKYGPIFSLRFGSRLLVLVSSSTLAEECFTKNDIVLANRPKFIVGRHVFYNHTIMATASYDDHWRNLRRIAAAEIFSSARLSAFSDIRKDEVKRLLLRLSRDCRKDFMKVQLKPFFGELMFNNLMRMVVGKRYFGDVDVSDEADAKECREVMRETFKNGGLDNPADFFPILKWFGQGFEKKMAALGKRMDNFLQKLVDEHRSQSRGHTNTMVDHLLSLQEAEPHYYTDQIIKGFVLVILFGGVDTSSVTLEWAMSNLLNHPEVFKKVKAEIEAQIGDEDRLIDEIDVSKLRYLQCVIHETLRMYPPGPLLLPHMPSVDCTIGGYDVPRDTIILVNAWAIHRDPNVWDDPTTFKPERFEHEKGDTYKLLPFGLGRRACPGANLAHQVLGLTLASLVQCFEWERIDGKEIDMKEGHVMTLPKAQPLVAMCKARPIVNKVLYEGMA